MHQPCTGCRAASCAARQRELGNATNHLQIKFGTHTQTPHCKDFFKKIFIPLMPMTALITCNGHSKWSWTGASTDEPGAGEAHSSTFLLLPPMPWCLSLCQPRSTQCRAPALDFPGREPFLKARCSSPPGQALASAGMRKQAMQHCLEGKGWSWKVFF